MSAVHLQGVLATVTQAIHDGISKQTELQTVSLDSKLNSVRENVKEEQKRENEKFFRQSSQPIQGR
jgi:hypothetical protein